MQISIQNIQLIHSFLYLFFVLCLLPFGFASFLLKIAYITSKQAFLQRVREPAYYSTFFWLMLMLVPYLKQKRTISHISNDYRNHLGRSVRIQNIFEDTFQETVPQIDPSSSCYATASKEETFAFNEINTLVLLQIVFPTNTRKR